MTATDTPKTVLSLAEIVAKSPDPTAAIQALGRSLARSQMMGPCDRSEIGEVVVLMCITEGMSIGDWLRTYQISFGRPERRIDSALADYLKRGGRIEWIEDGSNHKSARARFHLADETLEASCTVEEAQRAGWTRNKKWETETQTMLRARVKKRGLLAIAPDLFYGAGADEYEAGAVAIDSRTMAAAAAARPVPPTAAPPQAPTPQASPPPQPSQAAQQPPAVPTPAAADPELPTEIKEQLVALIGGDRLHHATAWARSVGWLPADAPLDLLPEKHARAILKRPEKFVAALEKFISGGAK